MRPDDPGIREFLAAALRKESQAWPAAWADPEAMNAVVRATHFHGIAGLLIERSPSIGDWPAEFTSRLFDEARARAMWELRHKQLLIALLSEFADRSLPCLIMKGTAVAYDLYPNPAARSRGDTDLLIDANNVAEANALLAGLGYVGGVLGGVTPEFSLQQVWTLSLPDGGNHTIDLHWQVMCPFAQAFARLRRMPFAFAHIAPYLSRGPDHGSGQAVDPHVPAPRHAAQCRLCGRWRDLLRSGPPDLVGRHRPSCRCPEARRVGNTEFANSRHERV
jgi:hypothetical protein